MFREYKKKRTKAYTLEELRNAVKNDTLMLKQAHQEYKIPLGTLSNYLKSKGKRYSNAGHPTVFTEETELLMAQHLSCLGEWGYPFDILDVRMFAKQVLCEEGRHVPQFNDNIRSETGQDCIYRGIKTKLNSENAKTSLCDYIFKRLTAIFC